jgi:uncharacterized protein (DUF58 family)
VSAAEPVTLTARWRVTPAHVRALLGGLVLIGIGVMLRRPDALVFGAPLLVVAMWSVALQPGRSGPPRVRMGVRHSVLREGQGTQWYAEVEPTDGVEDAGATLLRTAYTVYTPRSRAVAAVMEPGQPLLMTIDCQSRRWGNRPIGPATVALSSAFGAYRWEPEAVATPALPTVPLPDTFTARAPVPHPDGLVGPSRSYHQGDGGELAEIRPFRFGDRLRRVHWPVSIRTGELHVTATHADQDSEILLLVDAMHDIGISEGVQGASSSLDNSVRAAGAIAEHYLRTGDRVGLLVLGARDLPHLRAASGRGHLRRVLDVLSRVRVADSTVSDEKRLRAQLRHPVSAGMLVIVLTPAISPEVLAHAVGLARRGVSVITVDTLPPDLAHPDIPLARLAELAPSAADHPDEVRLAWRLRLLERAREMARARETGVPIVAWAGPGTLDLVLRDLARRSRSPRVVSR